MSFSLLTAKQLDHQTCISIHSALGFFGVSSHLCTLKYSWVNAYVRINNDLMDDNTLANQETIRKCKVSKVYNRRYVVFSKETFVFFK